MNTIKVPPRRDRIVGTIALEDLHNVRVPDFHLLEDTPDGEKPWTFDRYDSIVLYDGSIIQVFHQFQAPDKLNGETGYLLEHLPSGLPAGTPDGLRQYMTPELEHYFVRWLPVTRQNLPRFLDAFARKEAVTLLPTARPFTTPQSQFISGYLHLLIEQGITPLMSDVSVVGWAGICNLQAGDHLQVYSLDGNRVLWSETLTRQMLKQLMASFEHPEYQPELWRNMPETVKTLNQLFHAAAPAVLKKAV